MSSIPIRPLEVIRDELASMPEAECVEQTFTADEVLMSEGECYDHISLIISGELRLTKRDEDGMEHRVGRVRSGQFLGLLQLSSGEPSFLTAQAKTDGHMLSINRGRFTELLYNKDEFGELVGPLLLGNLVHRYRRVVQLHLKVSDLTRDLEAEKSRLEQTIEELEATRNKLIQQEKMATLGQLVAGIAHEINNPIASLSRAADSIEPHLERSLSVPIDAGTAKLLGQALHAGLTRGSVQTESQRARIDELEKRFPTLARPVLRSLSQIEPAMFDKFEAAILRIPKEDRDTAARRWMDAFEAGVLIRNMRVASTRIGNIVGSLKGYSRQDRAAEAIVDVREGLQDTLVLFGYVLKKFTVEADLPEIPKAHCHASELNQVWTNLILNACQAMGESGRLRVSCGNIGNRMIWVNIQDSGPGVPDSLRQRIFEKGFSTKESGTSAGMGLGLAIAKGIVEKHEGRIEVENVAEGGAAFTVFLPTATADPVAAD